MFTTLILYFISFIYTLKFVGGDGCVLTIPDNPLTAIGLATPYILSSNCSVLNMSTTVFSEVIIINTNTREYSIYNPLIVNNISQLENTPVIPILPRKYIIGIWFTSEQPFTLLTKFNLCENMVNTNFAYCNIGVFYNYVISLNVFIKSICPSIRDYPMQLLLGNRVMDSYIVNNNSLITQTNSLSNNISYIVENTSTNDYIFNNYVNKALNCPSLIAFNIQTGRQVNSMILNQIQAIQYGSGTSTYISKSIQEMNFWRLGLGQNINVNTDQFIFCNESDNKNALFLYNNYEKLYYYNSPEPTVATNLVNYLAYLYVKNWNNVCINATTRNIYAITVYYNNQGIVSGNNINDLFNKINNNNTGANYDVGNYSQTTIYLLTMCIVIFAIILSLISCIYMYKILRGSPVIQPTKVISSEKGTSTEQSETIVNIDESVVFYTNMYKEAEKHKLQIEEDRKRSQEQLANKLSNRRNTITNSL